MGRRKSKIDSQSKFMTPVKLELMVREAWAISSLKLLRLDKMTHFGRILRFTISYSRAWPLHRSSTELASRINVI